MIADLLSASRIVLAILFVLLGKNRYFALSIIAIAGLTDMFDGIIARKTKETKFGNIIDPIADRIFALAVMISLVLNYGLNIFYGILMLSRDIMNSVILPIIYLLRKSKHITKVNIFGKITTVFLIATFIAIILNTYAKPLIYTTIVISIISALYYFLKFNFPKA